MWTDCVLVTNLGDIVLSLHTLTLALLYGAWLAFIVWTVYRLGSANFKRDEFVSKFGVKEFGLVTWLGATGIGTYASYKNKPDHSVIYYAGYYGFFLLPLCLWVGFAWGK